MKTTTTLMDMIQSEMIRNGYNEFDNNNQLSFFDKKHSFIIKLMRMDKDVKPITDDLIFQNLTLKNKDSDKLFKQAFFNRFLNRQIAFQTVEAFSSQVVYVFLTKYDYLNYLYDELDDFVKGLSVTDTVDNTINISDFRQLFATLPQNTINMNLDNPVMEYADENLINKRKDEKDGTARTTSKRSNIDDLLKIKDLLEEVFREFDKKCFLQIW